MTMDIMKGDNKMLLGLIILFAINYCAVRLAIKPLLERNDRNARLNSLRSIGILNNRELEEINLLYKEKGIREEDNEQYQEYAKTLKTLRNMEYFNDEEYVIRIAKLKSYFYIS